MLKFRKIDYNRDLNQIITLIQKNLDPDFTVELFKWKHLDNPFGKSYGLLALDDEKIVGLRMFMFWNFTSNGSKSVIKAIRPVDTVVDKNFRGQGLFKKLTLTGLDECRGEYDFIFNTPNENSLPGYLKMGWEKLKQENYFKVGLVNPFCKAVQFQIIDPELIKNNRDFEFSAKTTTYTTLDYFKWRYRAASYSIAFFPNQEVYVAYSMERKFYLILYEVFGNTNALTSEMLNSLSLSMRKPLIYFYDSTLNNKNLNFLLTKRRSKPVIVLKDSEEVKSLNINFSLADLEAVF